MAITNLTNTKWIINDEPEISGSLVTFNINFLSMGDTYSSFKKGISSGDAYIYYDNAQWYDYYDVGWDRDDARIIEITGGSDVTNATLIAWLEANATQVQVTSLANTKWVLDNVLSIEDNPFYAINFSSNNTNYIGLSFYYFYDSDFEDYTDGLDYKISENNFTDVYYRDSWLQGEAYKTIEIGSTGTDIANPDLIAWLTENATLQQPNAITFDLSTLQLSAGTHTIQVKARATGYKDSEFSNSVSYEVSASGGTVTLIVDEYELQYKSYFRVYDGQDDTGTLLFDSSGSYVATPSPTTVVCTTGYLHFKLSGGLVDAFGGITTTGNIAFASGDLYSSFTYSVASDGSITFNNLHWDD